MKVIAFLVLIVVAFLNISRLLNKAGSPIGAPRDPIKRLDMLYTDLGRLVQLSSDPLRPEWKRQAELKVIGKRIEEIEQVLCSAERNPKYASQAKQYRAMLARFRG